MCLVRHHDINKIISIFNNSAEQLKYALTFYILHYLLMICKIIQTSVRGFSERNHFQFIE